MADKTLFRLADIRPHPENPRQHPEAQVSLIRKGLRLYQQYRPVVVWKDPEDGLLYCLAGHAVIEAALREGWKEIWAEERSDLTRAQARALVAYDNKVAELSMDDQDALSQLVSAVHAEDASLAELAAGGQEELRRLLEMAGQEPKAAPEAQIDRADELQEKWQVKTGDLWGMGPYTRCPKCGKEHPLQ